ncbi:hypothetical protein ABID26_006880 [Mesorhizobium shonense]|uniref:Uncharacterized protein n=1 Tax=Mesorhizobium shonense TaxID=1209948 RepID=A0ABV2I3M4_9HYPH
MGSARPSGCSLITTEHVLWFFSKHWEGQASMHWIQVIDVEDNVVVINPQRITHMKRILPSTGHPGYTVVYFGYAQGDRAASLRVKNDVEQIMQLSR